MGDVDFNALIALLPADYRPAALALVQLIGALIAAFSVLVPLVEKLVKATPSKSDDAYWEKLARVRNALSVFPRIVVPRLSQAPTRPAPAPVLEAAAKINVNWPDAQTVAEATKASLRPGSK